MSTTCLKCGYSRLASDTAPATQCPKCGAIYAKVAAALGRGEAAVVASGSSHEPGPGNAWVKRVLLLGVIAVVGAAGHAGYSSYSKRQAALAHCAADRLAVWTRDFDEINAEFERAASAAGIAPRMTLAPLILRMSEAHAKAAKLDPPLCAAEGAKLLRRGMAARIEAMHSFALSASDLVVAGQFARSKSDGEIGRGLIAEAARQAVK